jgi:hypothetical protein
MHMMQQASLEGLRFWELKMNLTRTRDDEEQDEIVEENNTRSLYSGPCHV